MVDRSSCIRINGSVVSSALNTDALHCLCTIRSTGSSRLVAEIRALMKISTVRWLIALSTVSLDVDLLRSSCRSAS